MKFDVATILQLITFVQQLAEKGAPAWNAVKQAAQAHGVDADTALLDGIILDAARQKALAEREASAPATASELGIHAGSTGD